MTSDNESKNIKGKSKATKDTGGLEDGSKNNAGRANSEIVSSKNGVVTNDDPYGDQIDTNPKGPIGLRKSQRRGNGASKNNDNDGDIDIEELKSQ